ncbi:MAG TPA: OmpA family protein [Spirochaetota bacterium]|nr:OmpA family protein [Spirochaetota bacterium]HPN14314.1 OmpA family protein [Spirochaetota bacterium]HQL84091.1 OmpA family protein [Spirochaetota bacterium]
MKKAPFYILILMMIFTLAANASPKDDATNKVAEAESMRKSLESNTDLSAFIPFDMFNMAASSSVKARNLLDNGKYADALFYAREAVLRFEIASLTAQARAARANRMILLSEKCSTSIMSNPVMDAQFLKKGDVFRANIYDRQIFTVKKGHVYYTLSTEGKSRLDKIIKVLAEYPNYRMKIVGHTAESDYNEYSKQKADIIAKYFYGKNIPSDRIEIMGLGNKEVIDTHLGFRRVDRIEFILAAPR